jgi:AcrR family transcriptional regulator
MRRPKSAESTAPARQRGRPRSGRVDEAVLGATLAELEAVGFERLTINAVARRSGVARATIYLRWPDRDALLAAAVRRAIGRDPMELTGHLERDLQRGAQQARAILAEPAFGAILPALMATLLRDPGPDWPSYDALFPSRRIVGRAYRDSARVAGLRTDVDGMVVVDLLIGAHVSQLLATGRPPSRSVTRQAVEIVLAGLRRPPPG